MNETTTRPMLQWSNWWHYDWGSWKSWRALLAHGAVVGVICGSAAHVSNAVVGGWLGMKFGEDSVGTADAIGLAIAVVLVVPMLVIFARILKRKIAPADRPYPFGQGGYKWEFLEIIVPFAWYLSVLVVFLGVYLGVVAMLATESTGRLAGLACVIGVGIGAMCLRAGLDKLGAKRLPSAPVGR